MFDGFVAKVGSSPCEIAKRLAGLNQTERVLAARFVRCEIAQETKLESEEAAQTGPPTAPSTASNTVEIRNLPGANAANFERYDVPLSRLQPELSGQKPHNPMHRRSSTDDAGASDTQAVLPFFQPPETVDAIAASIVAQEFLDTKKPDFARAFHRESVGFEAC